MKNLTVEKLKELLHYDPLTGIFTNRVTRGRRIAGAQAGMVDQDGHIEIVIEGAGYRAHRLAWLYMTGEWPVHQIDHKDKNGANNAFLNLRDVPWLINAQNRNKPPANKKYKAPLGAQWVAKQKRWRSKIFYNGKTRSLGFYASAEDAHEAYILVKQMCHPGFIP